MQTLGTLNHLVIGERFENDFPFYHPPVAHFPLWQFLFLQSQWTQSLLTTDKFTVNSEVQCFKAVTAGGSYGALLRGSRRR